MKRKTRGLSIGAVSAAVLIAFSAIAAAAGASTPKVQSHAATGSLNVAVVGGEWPSLDPAAPNGEDALDATEYNAIYGGLFEFGPGSTITDDLATGYKWTDNNKEVLISIRPNVTFSNGDPFNAAAVVASLKRALVQAAMEEPIFAAVSSVTASGTDTVVLHMSQPYGAIIQAFQNASPNWVVDTAALAKEGETKFAFAPVAAGPYTVVSGGVNSPLSLQANPKYWRAGYPKIEKLNFNPITSDESAYSSLETGETQVVDGASTTSLIQQQQKSGKYQVIAQPAQFYEFISLNTTKAPFNNVKARKAIYEATNAPAIVKDVDGGLYKLDESPSAPGETWYEQNVPGFQKYNLAGAKSLVKSLGGLTVVLASTSNTPAWIAEVEALQGQWEQAGIKVSLSINTLVECLEQLKNNTWEALDSNWGGSDPTIAMPYYFSSTGGASGIRDPVINSLLTKSGDVGLTTAQVNADFAEIAERMAKNYNEVFMYSKPFFLFALKSVSGIPANNFNTYWEDVSIT